MGVSSWGRPMISAMVSDTSGPATSWQKSTSPLSAAAASTSRQRLRICRFRGRSPGGRSAALTAGGTPCVEVGPSRGACDASLRARPDPDLPAGLRPASSRTVRGAGTHAPRQRVATRPSSRAPLPCPANGQGRFSAVPRRSDVHRRPNTRPDRADRPTCRPFTPEVDSRYTRGYERAREANSLRTSKVEPRKRRSGHTRRSIDTCPSVQVGPRGIDVR